MPRRQVHGDSGSERDARDLGALDANRAKESGELVGISHRGIRAFRLVALAGTWEVHRDAAEMLCVGRQLERVAGMVSRQIRNQQQRIAFALYVVVDAET